MFFARMFGLFRLFRLLGFTILIGFFGFFGTGLIFLKLSNGLRGQRLQFFVLKLIVRSLCHRSSTLRVVYFQELECRASAHTEAEPQDSAGRQRGWGWW